MRRESTPPHKDVMITCPRLWHLVSFDYCSRENGNYPCHMAIDCWYDYFLVEDYFRELLTPEEWDVAFGRPQKGRLTQLLEAVDEVGKFSEPS
jgi:hypothetical protein